LCRKSAGELRIFKIFCPKMAAKFAPGKELEQADISFQDLFYPQRLRCPLEKRIAKAIEENWPACFPARKECRGSN